MTILDQRTQDIIARRKVGQSVAHIAAHYGLSQYAVRKALRRDDGFWQSVALRSANSDRAKLDEAVQMVLAGKSHGDVAKALGLTRNQVGGAVYRHKRHLDRGWCDENL